ncbi:MAG: glycosyltransferase family 2 protein, partial [Parcubacteria group bacterium]|nr:glycosyltransferase family 2 protein [Parcubacteria group bacterium]
ASTDGSREWLRQNAYGTLLIENKENAGFAGGNNIGMQKAIEWGADYIYLLNQDTEVAPDFLIRAVETAESNPRIGSVQSFLRLHPEVDLVNTTGNAVHYLGFGFCDCYKNDVSKTLKNIEVWKKNDPLLNIAYGSGAGILYRTSALHEVGLLDEDLFLYHEDLDLGWRLRLQGYENVLSPLSVVYHKYEFSRSIQKYYWMERNRFIVMFQNYKFLTILLILPALFLMELGLFIFSFIGGWWREKLKVYRYFLKLPHWFKILKKRRIRQGERKMPDRLIIKYFTGRIEFQDMKNPVLTYIANPIFDLYWKLIRKLILW